MQVVSNAIFFKSSILVHVLTYPLILGNNKTNDLITLPEYSIKYLELFLV